MSGLTSLQLRFTYVDGTLTVALLLVAALAASGLLYLRSFRGGFSWTVAALALLRFGAIATALVVLLRPVVSYDRIHRSTSRVAVLVDRSRSMAARDSLQGESRLDSALRVVSSEAIQRLRELFQVELYAFSGPETLTPWEPETPGATPAPDGTTTDLASAWRSIPSDAAPLEAIVLVSDGRDFSEEGSSGDEGTPRQVPSAPVHAIAVGSGEVYVHDASWVRIDAERKALQGNRVAVRGKVRLRGAPALRATVVMRLDDTEVSREEVSLREGLNDVALEIVPSRAGSLVYEVALESTSPDDVPPNDRTYLPMEVSDRRLQALVLEGRTRWQYKFLRRALEDDPSLNVTALIQLGQGRRLEQGKSPVELAEGLPRSRADWKAFQTLILGNVVSEELDPGDAERIRAWVLEDGGGLILSGGPESLTSLAAGPLGDLLPVTAEGGGRIEGELRVELPLEAMSHPIARGLGGYFSGSRSGGAFLLDEAFDSGRVRPSAEAVLLVTEGHREEEAPESAASEAPSGRYHSLLAARQFGKGRVLAWCTESDWKWVLERSADEGDRLFATLWGRMVRWAASREAAGSDGPRIELSRRTVREGEEVEIALAGPGAASDETRVSLVEPDGTRRAVPRDLSGAETWTGRARVGVAGVHAVVVEAGGRESAREALIVEPDTRELEEPSPDWPHLRELASGSGGRFLTLAELGTLADGIVAQSGGSVTHVELGLERSWIPYLLLVALLTAEWLLRRRVHVV